MTRYIFLITFLTFNLYAQILRPASWSYELSRSSVAQGDTLTLLFKVKVDEGWYIYGSDFPADLGPLPTELNLEPNASYEAVDSLKTIGAKRKYDDIFEMEYTAFKKTGLFTQIVKINTENPIIEGEINYQVCTDKTGRCIQLQETFTFSDIEVTDLVAESSDTDRGALLDFFLLAFLAGLASILTPCVFPLIPLTVSVFNQSNESLVQSRLKASLYGLSIIVIYVLLGILASLLMGPDTANFIISHWLPNTIFFLIFFLFALSFFGMFDLALPSGLVNRVDSQRDRSKGYAKVFFMALTLVLVSFSCTGPIVGSLLVASASGELLYPIIGMLGFGLAFGLPFSFFAFFPSVLQRMPKSGSWLSSIKVTLGFIELVLCLKFLSNIDQAYHLGILSRDLNIAFWIAIITFMGLYYLGKIPLDYQKVEKIGALRMLLALVCFSFVIYLLPGMFGAPLKAFSGFLPPKTLQEHDLWEDVQELNYKLNPTSLNSEKSLQVEPQKYAHKFKIPFGIKGYFEYEEALAAAQKANKPLLLDFTGHTCSNCRRMEEIVWSDERVLRRLKNDVILASLYVDDKTVLSQAEWKVSDYDGKLKKTIGAINADLQITRFKNNAQPFYVILNLEGLPLLPPKAYDLNIQNFIDFLDKGKEMMGE